MLLLTLSLQDFRSYRVKKFSFDKDTTLVVGDNAAGKTNLLEAIWMISSGKSFRATKEMQMIRNSEQLSRVTAQIRDGDLEELEVVLTTGEIQETRAPKKRYLINGAGKRRIDFVGKLKAVLFRPEDLRLLLGSPARRRDYLDSVLEQVDREYRRSLLSYKKGLRQRNKLLEKIREREAQRKQLLFWNQLLIKNGEVVTNKREEFLNFVNAAFGRARISQVFDGLEVRYDRSVMSEKRLQQYRHQEVAAGVTLVGPHRDDLVIRGNTDSTSSGKASRRGRNLSIYGSRGEPRKGRNLSVYGSRGEQRLAILALKLAELSFVTQKVRERPLLLLDDIFSELDHEHRKDVLEVVGQQQTILTTTDLHLVEAKYRKKMRVVEL